MRQMPHRPLVPLDLLTRSDDVEQLLRFFQALEEEIVAATADAVRTIPQANVPSAKQARGTLRRHFMERAVRAAGARTALEVGTSWTTPATWSYPTVRIGAFTLVLGLVFSRYNGAPRQLRTRSSYVKTLCARNAPLDPQGALFEPAAGAVSTLIPDGAFGGLIVSEHNAATPEIPSFVGLWVPSTDLKQRYHSYSFEQIMGYLREKIAGMKKPVRKAVQRKLPKLRKKPAPKK
ncbi:hypothetical protein GGQ80_001486 [Sphingomonas jinjuensis]|uniref:Uncharacterized protein n=2 Tax=Sphingomonas jinjuensis TaxID=535907 RepID=A0A840FCV7_9SPHN|nr:hypothetical protein [Sphingomonas jinjuensis]